jgi:hypothetical protein
MRDTSQVSVTLIKNEGRPIRDNPLSGEEKAAPLGKLWLSIKYEWKNLCKYPIFMAPLEIHIGPTDGCGSHSKPT